MEGTFTYKGLEECQKAQCEYLEMRGNKPYCHDVNAYLSVNPVDYCGIWGTRKIKVWNYKLFVHDQCVDETQINEHNDDLAWEVFRESHTSLVHIPHTGEAYITSEEDYEVVDIDDMTPEERRKHND